jgi:hypothetical protein
MPVELPIDQASNQQSVLAAVSQECAGPGGRAFSAANFQFSPPDQNWINTARRKLQPVEPGGHRAVVPNIYLETKFKAKFSTTRETFDVILFYMDPADGSKKPINVGTITED